VLKSRFLSLRRSLQTNRSRADVGQSSPPSPPLSFSPPPSPPAASRGESEGVLDGSGVAGGEAFPSQSSPALGGADAANSLEEAHHEEGGTFSLNVRVLMRPALLEFALPLALKIWFLALPAVSTGRKGSPTPEKAALPPFPYM
jgi:hypothetical protein